MFSATSRYYSLPTAVCELPDGRSVRFVQRRLLPQPEQLAQIGERVVKPRDRLDRIAGEVFGDAEQCWRIADANRAMDPDALTAEPGRRLRITLPPGIPAGGTGG